MEVDDSRVGMSLRSSTSRRMRSEEAMRGRELDADDEDAAAAVVPLCA